MGYHVLKELNLSLLNASKHLMGMDASLGVTDQTKGFNIQQWGVTIIGVV